MTRHQKLQELYEWAKEKPLNAVPSRISEEARRRYHCTPITAEDYAKTVKIMLQEAQKPLASVQ